ncbi:MAG: hypothetical protein HY395_03270 [Candidatus Doudnabacteria bacterium]|nr:hypothetical protein [Candidatus Doudnabacteria bacterium]
MKKIISSFSIIALVAAFAIGGTTAFFSDTETSTGNVFTAGSIDLKVDSQCHYYQYDPENEEANEEGYVDVGCDGFGVWEESDLGVQQFFDFSDLKPGDWGEDTISLHVYDNDAWGQFNFQVTSDKDNSCQEPEIADVDEPACAQNNAGELRSQTLFTLWLDQGSTPGFQNYEPDSEEEIVDEEEGDNVWQSENEPVVYTEAVLDNGDNEVDLASILSNTFESVCEGDANEDGDDDYGYCHGIAEDGRLVGSTTYQFGLMWSIPTSVGNEAQTDSFGGDVVLSVAQHRNQSNPYEVED